MKRIWPIIAVSNVVASVNWYKHLLRVENTHSGSSTFDQIIDEDGTILLCFHHWGASGASGTHQWSTLQTPSEFDHNGLLLWFVVDDLQQVWNKAQELKATVIEKPNMDNGTGELAFVVCDPDGYHVAINQKN